MDSSSALEEQATLPTIIDNRAATDPDRLFAAVTWVDDFGKVQLRNITYRKISDATNRAAHWLHERFGVSSDFKILAYAGPPDLRYHIITVAAAKTGHAALLLSSWAPLVAQAKLLEEANCTDLIVPKGATEFLATVNLITVNGERRVHQCPELDWFLDGPPAPSYPMYKTIEQLHDKDYVVIHTSGSTGAPKLMHYKYNALAALQWLSKPEELFPGGSTTQVKELWKGRCHLLAVTLSHAVGLLGLGPWVIYYNMPMILPPPDRKLNPDILSQIFQMELCEAAIIAPAYLQILSRDVEKVETLRELKHLIWIGAPFPSREVADAVRSRVHMETAFGSTEAALMSLVPEHQDHYEWLHFHEIVGAHMRHFSEDLYEQVFVRDARIEKAQFVFQNFAALNEFETKDLFSRHPEHENLWRFRARKDDLIVLSTGLNIEPCLLETAVSGHPNVRAVLVYGVGRTKPSLLIEEMNPPASPDELHRLREEIWSTIERTNEAANQHGRIQKSMVIFATPDKPFKRADKGSVQRQKTFEDYQAEIDNLYAQDEGIQIQI